MGSFSCSAVTREWNRHWNKSPHRKLTEEEISPAGIRTHDLSIMSLVLCHWTIPAPFANFVSCFGKTTRSSGDLIVFLPQRTWACNLPHQIVVCKLFIVELNNMWDKCEHFSKCKFLQYHFSQLFEFFVFISNMTRIKYKFIRTCRFWPRAIASSRLFSYQPNLLMTDHWKSEAKWSRCCCDGISFGKFLLMYLYFRTLLYSLVMSCENKRMKH